MSVYTYDDPRSFYVLYYVPGTSIIVLSRTLRTRLRIVLFLSSASYFRLDQTKGRLIVYESTRSLVYKYFTRLDQTKRRLYP